MEKLQKKQKAINFLQLTFGNTHINPDKLGDISHIDFQGKIKKNKKHLKRQLPSI